MRGFLQPVATVAIAVDDWGDDQTCVLLVAGWRDVPWGIARAQAFLAGLHIMLPEFSFFDIRRAEFPVLFRLVDEWLPPFVIVSPVPTE